MRINHPVLVCVFLDDVKKSSLNCIEIILIHSSNFEVTVTLTKI